MRRTCLTFALVFLCIFPFKAQTVTAISAPERDSQALQTLGLAIQALGGQAAWNSIHSSDVQGTFAKGSVTAGSEIHWVDTWSKGGQMRRSRRDPSGQMKTFTEDSEAASSQSSAQSSKTRQPKYDPFVQLLTHMPGAALVFSAKDRYSVTLAQSPPKEKPADCIEIKKDEKSLLSGGVEATLCFDKETHLPAYARLMLASLESPSRRWPERIQYGAFQRVQGVLVPGTVIVTNPVGQKTTYTFSSIVLNPENPQVSAPGDEQ